MNESFSQRIKHAREQAGLSQRKLGRLVGVSGAAVQQWERGGAMPRTSTLKSVCTQLGVPIAEILELGTEVSSPPVSTADTFGARMRQALKEASYTQAGLARAIGIRAQAVQYLCSDRVQWSKHTHTIAQLLGVNSRWLASGSGPMRGSGSVVPFRDEETTKLRATIARLEREKQQLLEMLVHTRSDVAELGKQTDRE